MYVQLKRISRGLSSRSSAFSFFIWSTKWPQYILTLTVPICLAAAEGFLGRLWEPLMRWLGRHRLQEPHPTGL